MPKQPVVRARVHHGARSLDLTIPADLCKTLGILEGDTFSVSIQRNGDIAIIYRRILKAS